MYTTILIIYLNNENGQYLFVSIIDTSYLVTGIYFVYQKLQAIDVCPCVYFI